MAVEGPTISGDGIQVFSSAYPFLVALAETDDTLVYSMVKVMLEHFDEYKGNAPGANGWAIDRQKFDQAFVPYHPGAIRYFKEIGIWSEAAEKPIRRICIASRCCRTLGSHTCQTLPKAIKLLKKAGCRQREAALETAGLITLGEGL